MIMLTRSSERIFNPSCYTYFNIEDQISAIMKSNIVYKYSCSQCHATYVGETALRFYTRIVNVRISLLEQIDRIRNLLIVHFCKHFSDNDHEIE